MTNLAMFFLSGGPDEVFSNYGLWLFLSVGAVALFGIFLPTTIFMEHRRKEREAFYKAETFRRIAEAPGDGGVNAVQLLHEQERIKQIKVREGLKIAGLINLGVGLALIIFLRALLGGGGSLQSGGTGPVYLCGLIPGFIGAAMIIYVYFLAAPIE